MKFERKFVFLRIVKYCFFLQFKDSTTCSLWKLHATSHTCHTICATFVMRIHFRLGGGTTSSAPPTRQTTRLPYYPCFYYDFFHISLERWLKCWNRTYRYTQTDRQTKGLRWLGGEGKQSGAKGKAILWVVVGGFLGWPGLFVCLHVNCNVPRFLNPLHPSSIYFFLDFKLCFLSFC